jgi:hypothetical protein
VVPGISKRGDIGGVQYAILFVSRKIGPSLKLHRQHYKCYLIRERSRSFFPSPVPRITLAGGGKFWSSKSAPWIRRGGGGVLIGYKKSELESGDGVLSLVLGWVTSGDGLFFLGGGVSFQSGLLSLP